MQIAFRLPNNHPDSANLIKFAETIGLSPSLAAKHILLQALKPDKTTLTDIINAITAAEQRIKASTASGMLFQLKLINQGYDDATVERLAEVFTDIFTGEPSTTTPPSTTAPNSPPGAIEDGAGSYHGGTQSP